VNVFLPEWLLWLAGLMGVLAFVTWDLSRDDWDYWSPLRSAALLFGYIALAVGVFIGRGCR
jgi:hypothetical protein